jgi:hypothetical protein
MNTIEDIYDDHIRQAFILKDLVFHNMRIQSDADGEETISFISKHYPVPDDFLNVQHTAWKWVDVFEIYQEREHQEWEVMTCSSYGYKRSADVTIEYLSLTVEPHNVAGQFKCSMRFTWYIRDTSFEDPRGQM